MGSRAVYTGFYSLFCNYEITPTVFSQMIKWAITKKTVKILWFNCLVAWKIFTFLVLKKLVMLHILLTYLKLKLLQVMLIIYLSKGCSKLCELSNYIFITALNIFNIVNHSNAICCKPCNY